MVGKPYMQSLSSRTSSLSPQRVPSERFQVPAQHHQTLVNVQTHFAHCSVLNMIDSAHMIISMYQQCA